MITFVLLQLAPDSFADISRLTSGGSPSAGDARGAAVTRPTLLIAAEPTTAVDVTVQRQVLDLLQRLRAQRHLQDPHRPTGVTT